MNALAGSAASDQLNSLSEDAVRRAITEFVENGKKGYNDPDFISQCLEARDRRATGEFDEYIESQFQSTWIEGGQDEIDELSAGV